MLCRSTSSMIPYLAELPPEIYSAILSLIPRDERQQTTLSLTRAIPRSPVPLHHLFECVHLKSAECVPQLYHRLRGRVEEPRWIEEFILGTWSVNADVVVNLVALFPRLRRITLFVGPGFAPEHLEEILEKPMGDLCRISLRFRPYVQKATYYQFLKGVYFDTALIALSRWPPANLPSLSIVQDPLDAEIASRHHFAQPLVFFRLDPIKSLACSPYLRSLTSLQLRIPSRQVAPFIYNSPLSMPRLRVLDLSTCHIRLADMEALIARFRQLQHLILDGCNIAGAESEWANVGKTCVLATAKAAREREKKLKTWLEAHAVGNQDSEPHTVHAEVAVARRARPGRRGLATATISLRDSQERTTPVVRTNTTVTVPRVRIVPLLPTLCSLSMTTSTSHKDKHDAIRAHFRSGWDEGLAQLTAIRGRLYQSWKNSVRMVRIAGHQGTEEGFDGLEDVDDESAFYGREDSRSVPVLCFAGEAPESAQHMDGCGHACATVSCV